MVSDAPVQWPLDRDIARLKPLRCDDSVLKIGHNIKYYLCVLGGLDLDVAPLDDTMVMSFDLDAGKNGHGMDELAKLHLGHECISFKSLCGTGKSQISFVDVPLDKATEYAAEDADINFRLCQLLKLHIPQEGVTRVYELVDRPLVR